MIIGRRKDHNKIAKLSKKISDLLLQTDSLTIYKEAHYIASINKDVSSKRVLNYLQLLENGKSIQEARNALSIISASKDLNEGTIKIEYAFKELEIRANASKSIFDYSDAIKCMDTIIKASEKIGIRNDKLSNHYNQKSTLLYLDGRYDRALDFQLKSNKLLEKNSDIKNVDLAYKYSYTGSIYNFLGEYKLALNYHKQAIGILEEILSSDNPVLAVHYSQIASVYDMLGKRNQALEYHLKSIPIVEGVPDQYSNSIATIYSNISSCYYGLEEYKTSLKYMQKSLHIREKIFSKYNPTLGKTYSDIAINYTSLFEDEIALKYHQKAISILEKSLRPFHPSLAAAYNQIATTYLEMDEYTMALKYQQKSIYIREQTLPSHHPNLAHSYMGIAKTYAHIEQLDEAIKFLEKSIFIVENHLNSDHPNLAFLYYLNSSLYASTDRFELALEFIEKCIYLLKKSIKREDFKLAEAYNYKARIYLEIGKGKKALKFQKKSTAIFEKIVFPNHLKLGSANSWLADIYNSLGKKKKAKYYELKSKEIFRNVLSPYEEEEEESLDYYIKARDDFDKGYYDLALENFLLGQKVKESKDGETWNYIGLCYLNLSKYPDAIKAFEKSVKLSPELRAKEYYSNVGLTYIKSMQVQKAYEAFEEYHKIFPDHGVTYRNWAAYYCAIKDYKRAFDNLKKAIGLGYGDLSWLYTDKSIEKLREEKSFNKIVSSSPNYAKYINQKAIDSYRKKNYEQAIEDFNYCILHSDTIESETFNYLGLCYYYLSNFSKSIEAYKKAVEIDPNFKNNHFYNNIGTAYLKNGQFQEAFKAFEEYQKLFPINGRVFRNWCMYYAITDEKTKALNYLKKAIKLGYKDLYWLQNDSSIQSLRNEKIFIDIISELKDKTSRE